MSERTADLVLGAENTSGIDQVPVREYREVYDFLSTQEPDTPVSLNWHYVDPTLRRKLSVSCLQRAISLTANSLEIPRFTAQVSEMRQEPCAIKMRHFTLKASGIFEPGTLFENYNEIRESMSQVDQSEPLSRRLNAPIGELRHSSPAA